MPTPSESITRLVLLLFRAQQAASADGDRLAEPFGLTSAQWKVLGAIELEGRPMSAAGIGRAMGLSRQAVLKQVDQLLDAGLLHRQADPRDARAPLHSLTPLGRKRYEAVMARWQQRAMALARGFDAGALVRTGDLLQELVGRLESEEPASRPSTRSRSKGASA